MESNKLPEDFKTKWVAALRSGEYKQGTCIMYDTKTDTYCCLGVAGAVCGAKKEDMGTGYFKKETRNLPPEYPAILLKSNHVRSRLMGMNDSLNKSFSEIADYIETNL